MSDRYGVLRIVDDVLLVQCAICGDQYEQDIAEMAQPVVDEVASDIFAQTATVTAQMTLYVSVPLSATCCARAQLPSDELQLSVVIDPPTAQSMEHGVEIIEIQSAVMC